MRHEGEADGTVRWSVEGNGYVTARGRRRKVNARSNSLNRANASGFNWQACVPVYAIVDHLLRRGDKKCGKLAAALRLIVLVDQDHLEAGLHFSGSTQVALEHLALLDLRVLVEVQQHSQPARLN